MAKTTKTSPKARAAKTKAAPGKRTIKRKQQQGSATTKQMAITAGFGAACAGLGALGYKLLAL